MKLLTLSSALLLATLNLTIATPTQPKARQSGTVIAFEGAGLEPPTYTLTPPFDGSNFTICTSPILFEISPFYKSAPAKFLDCDTNARCSECIERFSHQCKCRRGSLQVHWYRWWFHIYCWGGYRGCRTTAGAGDGEVFCIQLYWAPN